WMESASDLAPGSLLLLEVRGPQRVDQPRVDEARRVALVIEIVILPELVDRGNRFIVERRVVAVVRGGRGAGVGCAPLEFGRSGPTQFLHLRRVQRGRRLRKRG